VIISRRTLPLLFALPTLALAACGGGSDADKIKDIVKNGDKDPTTICDNASKKLKAQLGGDKCKDTARAYSDNSHVVGDIKVDVNGDTATATFKSSDGKTNTPKFIKEDGDWKVDSPS
jgi:hypothetical protein